MEKTLGIIPARFGSKRFPGKPLAIIKSKTLLQRTYENAKNCERLNALIVATDDKSIYEHVLAFGGSAVMTSSRCQSGTERVSEVVKDPSYSHYATIVNIQADEPLIETHVIEAVVDALAKEKQAVAATAVSLLPEEDAYNFSVVKCVSSVQNQALYFSRALIPAGHHGKWQSGVNYLKHLGIYSFRRNFLLKYPELTATPLQLAEELEQLKILEHGYHMQLAHVNSASIGVDRPEDIKKIEKRL